MSINISKYKYYWKICPYLIDDFYNIEYYDRRCELYQINNNTRYKYQYICSYDSSKDFKNKFKRAIEDNNIFCISANNIIYNNKIIEYFYNKYEKFNKYYCSRTDQPTGFSYVHQRNCNKTKNSLLLLFMFLMFSKKSLTLLLFAIVFMQCLL
jgi:hypothetical protein